MSNADPQVILSGGRITGMADGEQPDDAATVRQLATDSGPARQGLVAWGYDPVACHDDETMVLGYIYFFHVSVPVGALISEIVIEVGDHDGTVVSDCFAGLYDDDGNRLALTADLGSAWGSIGEHISPFIAPVVMSETLVYVALLVGTKEPGTPGADTPGLVSVSLPGANGQPNPANFGVGSGLPRYALSAEASHTTLPTTYDLSTLDPTTVENETMPWIGLR